MTDRVGANQEVAKEEFTDRPTGESPVALRSAQLRSESGAGSVLAVAVLGMILALASLLLPLSTVLIVRHRALGAADAAALAAADVASGVLPGSPCEIAASVAAANSARLEECQADGVIVTVVVSARIFGFSVLAAATAGPPGSA